MNQKEALTILIDTLVDHPDPRVQQARRKAEVELVIGGGSIIPPRKPTFEQLVTRNLARAQRSHGPGNSYHHYYGVLVEELQEFFDEVRLQYGQRSCARILRELVDIATAARRAAEDMKLLPFAPEDT